MSINTTQALGFKVKNLQENTLSLEKGQVVIIASKVDNLMKAKEIFKYLAIFLSFTVVLVPLCLLGYYICSKNLQAMMNKTFDERQKREVEESINADLGRYFVIRIKKDGEVKEFGRLANEEKKQEISTQNDQSKVDYFAHIKNFLSRQGFKEEEIYNILYEKTYQKGIIESLTIIRGLTSLNYVMGYGDYMRGEEEGCLPTVIEINIEEKNIKISSFMSAACNNISKMTFKTGERGNFLPSQERFCFKYITILNHVAIIKWKKGEDITQETLGNFEKREICHISATLA